MQTYSSDALVLRTYRYGEADQIVVFLTEDRGKKRGVAKNATKSRRRFGGGLESLSRGQAAYVEHEMREHRGGTITTGTHRNRRPETLGSSVGYPAKASACHRLPASAGGADSR